VSARVVAIGCIAALVVIGTFEAAESARQLADLTGFSQLRPTGAGLTAVGVLASSLIYLALGWWLSDDGRALRIGASVGLAAGLIGGSIRAWLIADVVRDAIGRYAAVPEWFVVMVLVVFVALSALVAAAAGAAIAFAGVRVSRSSRSRPRS
jgi:hypothetical protein